MQNFKDVKINNALSQELYEEMQTINFNTNKHYYTGKLSLSLVTFPQV